MSAIQQKLAAALFVLVLSHDAATAQVADLILIHAKVLTLDERQPTAEALAVVGNRIARVGTNQEILKLAAKHSRVLDAGGRLVLPGFNDAHVHFVNGGRQLKSVDLRDSKSPEEFAKRIADFAAKLPPGAWITGGDWDHENWATAQLPTRHMIDSVTKEHPVLVNRLDGHMSLANSLALRLGGVTDATPDPPGGLIVRASNGEATGILKDAAMAIVAAQIPSLSREERLDAARAATNHAASLGVTSVQDMSGSTDFPVYEELLKKGTLKTRIYVAAPLPDWQRSANRGLKAAAGNAWLRQGALKGFADGSLGSTTAYFFEPYSDASQTRGLLSDEMVSSGTMLERVRRADRAGLHVMIHAIGDQANHEVLTIFENVRKGQSERDRRFRIEHAQHLRLADIPRFARAKVIASMQPYHCADDGRWAEKRIGPERCQGTYAFRSLLDGGAILAFGSDWNVAPLDPIQGIAAAVTRRTIDGKHPHGWVPEQKITVAEAVRAYTVGSAIAEFQEQEKGTLAAGKLSDFVILSKDLFSIPVEDIESTKVVTTVVDGKIVFER